MGEVHVRRNYKDSLFRKIFQEKEELLELYNAVNGSDYTNPDELIITTIEDVLYLGIKNDVSFLIDQCLNLYETQSTRNPNMPLRGLFYFSQIYQGYVNEHQFDIYSRTLLNLPTPKYVVFYNGTANEPDRTEMRLSDSYLKPSPDQACLECVAIVMNINYGRNSELMDNCRKLYEYAYLISSVRALLARGLTLDAAVDGAVTDCIQNGILKSFLLKHRGEVTNMILAEDFSELHMRSEKEISFAEGEAKGEVKGREITLLQIVCKKLQKGMAPEEIADILEQDITLITRICLAAKEFAPEYDCEKIFQELKKYEEN